jgi:rSAM/selenodomain-associated transferase 2/rSAM/selenodomain-associated transferase 1
MTARARHKPDRLIVFGRYPVPGRTKTRLIPALGPAGAAELQRRMTERMMATVRAVAERCGASIEFRYEGGNLSKMRRWLGPDLSYLPQAGEGLGERMRGALEHALRDGCRRVVLVGTDVPELPAERLRAAFEALPEHDLVLGPSTDGGYWLIGLSRPVDVFSAVPWGTAAVLNMTLDKTRKQGLSVHLLEALSDIDTPDDLEAWPHSDLELAHPYLSVVIPTLNEAMNIDTAIATSKQGGDDVETIVVDGGSTDDTVVRARRAGARVEIIPPGRALQQNLGAELARGHVLLFLHADTRLPSDYVNHVFDTLMEPEVAAGAFRFETDLDRPLMRIIERVANIRSRYLALPYGDQAIFLARSTFAALGGFPEVPIAEDLQLVLGLARRGRIRIAPAAAVTSARRWQKRGILSTTLINYLILAGVCLGISPRRLVSLYGGQRGKSGDG